MKVKYIPQRINKHLFKQNFLFEISLFDPHIMLNAFKITFGWYNVILSPVL